MTAIPTEGMPIAFVTPTAQARPKRVRGSALVGGSRRRRSEEIFHAAGAATFPQRY